MRIRLGFLLLLLFLVSPAASAQSKPPPDEGRLRDAKTYLAAVSEAKELSIDDQVEFWRRFLDDHPETSFREEIETNRRHLDEFLMETNPARKREQKDSDRYLRAVELSKKLPEPDQIDLWEQFLEENPKSLYRKEILQKLEGLYARQKKPRPVPGAVVPKPISQLSPTSPIAPRLAYKDRSTAILLGTLPGLIVPGIAHWYTRDYTLAGILTGVRVGSIAVLIPGILDGNSAMIIAGAVLAGFTYIVDIADAPFAVDRYNDNLEQGSAGIRPEKSLAGLSLSFNF